MLGRGRGRWRLREGGERDVHARTDQFRVLALLCADVRSGRRTGEVAQAASAVEDWAGFADLVAWHRVTGLAHAAILRVPEAFPPDLRRDLAKKASVIAVGNLAVASETAQLQRLFDGAGIEATFFKGATLAQRAYGTLLTKQSKDVDFLVPVGDLARAIGLLESRGYVLEDPPRALNEAQWASMVTFGMEVQMVNTRTRIRVEPHWKLTANPGLLASAQVLAAVGKGGDDIAGIPIRTLHPDDLYAYLCVHGAASGWFRLKWLADLNALIEDATLGELDRLDRHAQSRGAGGSSALALSLCAAVFDRDVPVEILRRVEARGSLRRLKSLCLFNLRRMDLSSWRLFRSSLLLAAAEGCLLAELDSWTTSVTDAIDLPLPRRLHFLYRIVRVPAWLARRAMRARRAGAG